MTLDSTIIAAALFDLDKLSTVKNPFEMLATPAMYIAYTICAIGMLVRLIGSLKENSVPQQSIIFVSIIILVLAAKPFLWSLSMNVAYFLPDAMMAEKAAKGESAGMLSAGNRLRIMAAELSAKQNDFSNHLEKYTMDENDPNSIYSIVALPDSEITFSKKIKGLFRYVGAMFEAAGDKYSGLAVGFSGHAITLIAWIGAILQVPAYILQYCLRHLFETTIPIGIALLTVPALRQIGTTYIGMCISVLLWPLGFLVVNQIADVSIDLCMSTVPAGGLASYLYLVMPLIPASILITGTFMVPSFCYSLCTQGGSSATPSAAIGGLVGARVAAGVGEKALGALGGPAGAAAVAARRGAGAATRGAGAATRGAGAATRGAGTATRGAGTATRGAGAR
jgi:hypothetical protein